jgi:hypothetical protein
MIMITCDQLDYDFSLARIHFTLFTRTTQKKMKSHFKFMLRALGRSGQGFEFNIESSDQCS